MDMKDYKRLDKAAQSIRKDRLKVGIVMLFAIAIAFYALSVPNVSNPTMLVFAAIVGAYMAINIGANDVANNVGPAVGSKAITLFGAIIIAGICEALGALIAGGDVVDTIKSGIINRDIITDSRILLILMFSALLAAALWLNLATFLGAPVSTTHSLVGGILGAGMIIGGLEAIQWNVLRNIALSWVVSPVMGGVIAATFLAFIKKTIFHQENEIKSAQKVVPILIAVMSFAFSFYLATKGLKKILPMSAVQIWSISLGIGLLSFLLSRPWIMKQSQRQGDSKEIVNDFFTIPLIFAAALLSFAHGANDVANAVGPLAAINQALSTDFSVAKSVPVPLWIMVVGALGLSLGLALYGPKLIKTVGEEITDLDKKRAFCVAMSAAITVLIASALGLPVSSTHIAVGGVFGVGFLREYLQNKQLRVQELILRAHAGKNEKEVEDFLKKYASASLQEKGEMLKALKNRDIEILDKKEAKKLKKAYKNELVKRSALGKIVASWLITVPCSALLGIGLYYLLTWLGL